MRDRPEPTALVLAGGDLQPTDRLRGIARAADLVVVADGGLRHAAGLGVSPTVIVGDFDSVEVRDLASHAATPKQRHPTDKRELDLELALAEAQRRGAQRTIVMGAFGSRLDQTLAALLVCARHQREGLACTLHGTHVDAYPLSAGQSVDPTLPAGTTFSVVALDDAVLVSIRGARYTADRIALPFGVGRGVSNESAGDTEVTCHRGLMVVIVERNVHA